MHFGFDHLIYQGIIGIRCFCWTASLSMLLKISVTTALILLYFFSFFNFGVTLWNGLFFSPFSPLLDGVCTRGL